MTDGAATPLFPVYLDLRGRLCIVVGDGERAEKKARALVAAGGDVAVIGAHPTDALMESGTEGQLTVEHRGYVRGDLAGAFVVLCMGQGEEVSSAVAAEAGERGCLVNVSGMPELCNFIMPSTLSRGSLQVAVSTGGAAPAAARLARSRISGALGEEWAAYASLLADVRALAVERRLDAASRADLLARSAEPAILERLAAGEKLTAKKLLREMTTSAREDATGEAEETRE